MSLRRGSTGRCGGSRLRLATDPCRPPRGKRKIVRRADPRGPTGRTCLRPLERRIRSWPAAPPLACRRGVQPGCGRYGEPGLYQLPPERELPPVTVATAPPSRGRCSRAGPSHIDEAVRGCVSPHWTTSATSSWPPGPSVRSCVLVDVLRAAAGLVRHRARPQRFRWRRRSFGPVVARTPARLVIHRIRPQRSGRRSPFGPVVARTPARLVIHRIGPQRLRPRMRNDGLCGPLWLNGLRFRMDCHGRDSTPATRGRQPMQALRP
jgi:hypothetical protein